MGWLCEYKIKVAMRHFGEDGRRELLAAEQKKIQTGIASARGRNSVRKFCLEKLRMNESVETKYFFVLIIFFPLNAPAGRNERGVAYDEKMF